MIVSRRTYNRWRGMYRQVLTERLRLRRKVARLEAAMAAQERIVTRLREAADDELADRGRRVQQLTQVLETTRRDQGAEVARLNARLERALGACARYRVEAADARRPRPVAPGGRALALSERARRSLAEQLAVVQDSNDAMSRELVDLRGTLTVARPAGREPGVAS
ncbi:hypothetical protein [Streptomyces triculaminicus]|uniref:hypothetical protein n=1 Tax=Streptomyces triculaminicus TaxID=2816232 RepID=UPI0037B7CDCC